MKGGGNEARYRWLADGTKAGVKSYRNTLLDVIGGDGPKSVLDSLVSTHPGITDPVEGGDVSGVSTYGLGDIVVPSWPGDILVDDKFMRFTGGLEYLGSLIYKRNADNELTLESTSFGGGRIEVSEGINGAIYPRITI